MKRPIPAILGLSLLVATSLSSRAADAPADAATIVPAVWRQHKTTVNFFGITTAYSCDGLEQDVRKILIYLGARKDAKVEASCPRGPEVPSHEAWIKADFYTLGPADSAPTAPVVKARWVPRQVAPKQPFFMGNGDCELVEQLKDLVTKSFSLRDSEYRTDCVPHEVTVDSFMIKGQALVALDQ